ncbi:MAG TPA: ABC-2 transporter permease [Clostridiaceae bacterium]|nr:ABC-2 transporter permease [Clostridiaceae bacterium]
MKGLLIKDWFVIWKQGRIMIILSLIYSILAVTGSGYFFAGFSSVFLAMLPLTVMGLDERCKWDHYAIALPYSRKDIVMSKYIITVLGALAASVLFIASTVIKWSIDGNAGDFMSLMKQAFMLMSLGLFYSTINLPIAFRFGVDKGRLWFTLITVIVVAALGGIITIFTTDMEQIGGFIQNLPFLVVPMISFALLAVSYVISVRIYENREL